jgi:hypothetical protein
MLYEQYWQPIADHPGQLGKLDKRAKKNDKSFLVHPEDRKRWLKWFGGKKIKEDLDDKDEFTNVPTQESVEETIRHFRIMAATNPKVKSIVKKLEQMYEILFGHPYNPPGTAPRM